MEGSLGSVGSLESVDNGSPFGDDQIAPDAAFFNSGEGGCKACEFSRKPKPVL